MAAWDQGSFLLSAAPGAGKTIPSLAFARRLLDAGTINRVHVVCPTTPLTHQWAKVAARLRHPPAARLRGAAPAARLPRHRRDVRAGRLVGRALGAAVRRAHADHRRRGAPPRRGARLGRGLRARVRRDAALAAAVGHAVSLRRQPDRRRALRGRPLRARRQLHVRRRGPRRDLPAGRLRALRRDAVLAVGRRGHRVLVLRPRPDRPRGEPPLPHGDLDRARRRPAAHPARGRRAPRRDPLVRAPRRRRARRHRRRRPRAARRRRC